MSSKDEKLYRIESQDTLVYTKNATVCDEFCAAMMNNGYAYKVRRVKRSQVPMRELKLVAGL